MTVRSRVNPNFPLPGIDQSSKGFRDNFSIIKTEIESLQNKSIQLTGDVKSVSVDFGAGDSPILITTLGKSYTFNFTSASPQYTAGILVVTHNFGTNFGSTNKVVSVVVANATSELVIPDSLTFTSTNVLTLDLTSYAGLISSTPWTVFVQG
jgi:hypothetical protein